MRLHSLTHYSTARRKRVGRGGKRGTFSGRGTKGQRSRAGRRIRPAERDLIIRLPKRRGFRNPPQSVKPVVLNLSLLAHTLGSRSNAAASLTLDRGVLREVGLIRKRERRPVKILGDGSIAFPLIVKNILVSREARAKIEKAGGKVL